eukprot:CAMPEP_0115065222 /NCGR_PEP_ID=MMETSP0227-20121206/10131_1 /TAXON_ID=89957 /ORGANISM="Polarella glacialis, Strain CCMP 1383" /LENGTH=52 /DNA_ID=CAMNT_0002450987 /DNA_START=908 /DNA_END=1066 /DNA_ORIENTATION=-
MDQVTSGAVESSGCGSDLNGLDMVCLDVLLEDTPAQTDLKRIKLAGWTTPAF